MAVLVTGGAGFIGSHLIQKLLAESDEPIVCLDTFNDYYDPARKRANAALFQQHPQVTLVEHDFCDQSFMGELFERHAFRYVIHLGAYAGVRYSVENPLVYQRNNVEGTASLLEAARRYPVQRLLLASSSTVYGEGASAPFSESAPLGIPLSPYGASKRAAELLGQTYHLLHGVPVVSLRLFSVYGPRLRPDLAMTIFTSKIFSGQPLPLFGDGSVRRDFTHVTDICTGLIKCLTAENVCGQAINLGHDEPVEIREVISLLASAIGKPAVIQQLPEKQGDMPLTHADLNKAQRLLDYRPTVPFEDGLREYVEWFRKNREESKV